MQFYQKSLDPNAILVLFSSQALILVVAKSLEIRTMNKKMREEVLS
jgi:hypothetical protein